MVSQVYFIYMYSTYLTTHTVSYLCSLLYTPYKQTAGHEGATRKTIKKIVKIDRLVIKK